MEKLSRRDLLKTSLVASGIGASTAGAQVSAGTTPPGDAASAPKSPRERLLLDFGWRFQLGHADDPARDFGFGANAETFAKSGGFVAPGAPNFDDSAWREIDLPHDWAVELPFEDARELTSHGFKPLGRKYPATSIGWYRRVFDLPASDAGKRLSIEFDGAFRDAMVVFNGHYMGQNMSGYAPFRFDVTDFANYGAKNVLVVRVDATLNEGWFYEGAGIYRHVWLTKTSPLHVAPWGTFVRSEVRPNAAVVRISTEVRNDSDTPEHSCRVVSTVVDGSGKTIGTARSGAAAIDPWGSRTFDHAVPVNNPALWSPDHPHMYRVLTTVESGGALADAYETPFGIRTARYDADKGFFLNGEPLKIKGTCNHQDHAGVGAALT